MVLRLRYNEPIYRYRFPLTDQDDYKGKITFTAIETNYDNLISRGADLINDFESRQEEQAELEVFGPLRITRATPPIKKPVGIVQLFLPQSLAFNDTLDYTNSELGAAGAAAAAGMQSGKGLGQLAQEAIGGLYQDTSSMIEAIKSDTFGQPAQLALLKTIGKVSDSVRGAVEVSTGLTLNPNTRSSLRGVAIRNFTFNFNLIPETRKEAEMIKLIIQFFREQMYPEDVNVRGVSVGYKFPNKFRINMNYDDKPVATKILDCFLENFQTNYNPNSMSFHEDGNFPEINISMMFREERTLRQKDIKEGF